MSYITVDQVAFTALVLGRGVAFYPGSRWAEFSIHYLRMRLISQKFWKIGNYRVISVKP